MISLFAEIWPYLLASALVGHFAGWLLWRDRSRRSRQAGWDKERQSLKADLRKRTEELICLHFELKRLRARARST